MKSIFACSMIFAATSCAPGSRNMEIGEHRAGLKTEVIYQSQEDILRDLKAQGKSKEDMELEKQLLPKGGWVYVKKGSGSLNTATSGIKVIGESGEAVFTSIDFMQINIDGQKYYECNELESERQPQNIFGKILLASPTYHSICKIEKSIDTTFDVILLNYNKSAIGKYQFNPHVKLSQR